MNNTIYVETSLESRFIGLGTKVNNELAYYTVNFIVNHQVWGVMVLDPDGDLKVSYTKINKSAMNIETEKYNMFIVRNWSTDVYEISFTEK